MTEYVLKINAQKKYYPIITKLLGVEPTNTRNFWELSINENNPLYTIAIDYFIQILEKNKELLNNAKYDITIWFYSSNKQINIEFSPIEMKKMAKNNITLCISYW